MNYAAQIARSLLVKKNSQFLFFLKDQSKVVCTKILALLENVTAKKNSSIFIRKKTDVCRCYIVCWYRFKLVFSIYLDFMDIKAY